MTATLEPRASHTDTDTQVTPAGAAQNPPTDQREFATQRSDVSRDPNFPGDQALSGTQVTPVAGDPSSAADQRGLGTHPLVVGGALNPPPKPAKSPVSPTGGSLALVDGTLLHLARLVDDLETFRCASANQLEVMTRVGEDKDGDVRGFALPADNPAVIIQSGVVTNVRKLEEEAVKALEKHLKRSPLGPWVLSQKGIGFKTLARLLSAVGDPYWNELHNRPRLVSELWSYCGYGDAQAQVKKAGHKVNWSPEAKMRGFLCIEPTTKMLRKPCHSVKDEATGLVIETIHLPGCTCSPWRVFYDEEKAKYRDSLHPWECNRCTGKGQAAAPIGSPRKAAHINQIAIRNTTKELLRQLWHEAKRLHEQA